MTTEFECKVLISN